MLHESLDPGGRAFNVLFLCTHNSARSIMAEALLNGMGNGRFRAFSAGSAPASLPHPFALETLAHLNLPTQDLRSKTWDEFAVKGAPEMDFVITVCDNAAAEVCPVWPGNPITAHWGVEDPSLYQGTDEEKRAKFAQVADILKGRIQTFVKLPIGALDGLAQETRLRVVGPA